MTILQPLTGFMLAKVFHWVPDWYSYVENMSLFDRPLILAAIAVHLVLFTLIGPIVEELYFRGFLLARMRWMGAYSVLLNAFLFSLYHFWSPWLILTRSIAFLPLSYVVYKKQSLRLAIIVHCLANFADVIVLAATLNT